MNQPVHELDAGGSTLAASYEMLAAAVIASEDLQAALRSAAEEDRARWDEVAVQVAAILAGSRLRTSLEVLGLAGAAEQLAQSAAALAAARKSLLVAQEKEAHAAQLRDKASTESDAASSAHNDALWMTGFIAVAGVFAAAAGNTAPWQTSLAIGGTVVAVGAGLTLITYRRYTGKLRSRASHSAAINEWKRCQVSRAEAVAHAAKTLTAFDSQVLGLLENVVTAVRPVQERVRELVPAWRDQAAARDLTGRIRIGEWVYESAFVDLRVPVAMDLGSASAHPVLPRSHPEWLSAFVLRALLALAPGQLKVDLIDAAGLGRSFGWLLNLPDEVRGARVADDERRIEETLLRIRSEIGDRIQNRLRNTYADIEAYNRENPALAIPHQLVVINDYPRGFSRRAIEVLAAIIDNGPRAGWHVVATDPSGELSRMEGTRVFDPTSREPFWLGAELRTLVSSVSQRAAVELDSPPDADVIARILERISEGLSTVGSVAVPFENLRHEGSGVWAGNSAAGLRIPIGIDSHGRRFSAVVEQELAHLLTGGPTGSGKSNLLHVLICSLALNYSPDELTLYLLDLKGIEFGRYRALPHAQVVATNCDAETALSVIERLLAEMRRRRKEFQEAEASSLQAYRRTVPTAAGVARLVLFIDELQWLAEVDPTVRDRVRNQLATLLAQGRAYGIHVFMATNDASQLPDGNLKVHIAMRIALLGNEKLAADILGAPSSDLALLKNPGEAVFNDAAGREDANRFVRIAYLPTHQLEQVVTDLSARDTRRPRFIDGRARPDLGRALGEIQLKANEILLGESVSIKRDASIALTRNGTHENVLMVGRPAGFEDEDAEAQANAVVTNGLLSLASGPRRPELNVIDLSSAPTAWSENLALLVRSWARPARIARNDTMGAELIDRVYADFEARRNAARQGLTDLGNDVFLAIFRIERFGAIRKDGYHEPDALKKLMAICEHGSGLGMFVLAYAMRLTTPNGHVISPKVFRHRVCFNLDEQESSVLLDSHAAAYLGKIPGQEQRAIYRTYDDSAGVMEKFKPYRPPTEGAFELLAERVH